jgi:type IV pilus assembly protein PilA
MEWINRVRKNKKGFTLVEIIVVLVILAILAAFLIPSMIGFVNEARGKAMLAEAREVYVAAQATATEYAAKGELNKLGIASGVAANLGSAKVFGTASADATPVITDPTSGAELTMHNYLSNDLKISTLAAKPTTAAATTTTGANGTKGTSYWEVKSSATGQVTEVLYIKDGYSITLAEPEGTSTVTKLN